MHDYTDICDASWSDIISNLCARSASPLTVHLPIQPAESPDLIHVGCDLTVVRRRVLPGVTMANAEAVREHPTWFLQFALDDPPFVPHIRLTSLSLADGAFPVATAEYSAWELLYRFEYACIPTGKAGRNLVCVRGSVRNHGLLAATAHVRAKLNIQRECDVFDYHYIPHRWDAGKWPACDKGSLIGDALMTREGLIGRVEAGAFSCNWEAELVDCGKPHNWRHDDAGHPRIAADNQLTRLDNAVHLQRRLESGEETYFSILILTGIEDASEDERAMLRDLDPESVAPRALAGFRSLLDDGKASLRFPSADLERIFLAMQVSTRQLLIRFPDSRTLMPTQGGSSERSQVWVWEAAFMLLPMLRLGHTRQVREAIADIFTLQDAGCPPHGRIHSPLGAIGTTGPRWLCTTGAAIAIAADFHGYTKDADFLAEYLPRLLRAGDWIANEVRATRLLAADGTRPPWYGLMPFGCGTDGDIGYIVAFSDAYSFWGLEKLTRMLQTIGHSRASEFAGFLAEYRADIGRAIGHLVQPDGRISRMIRTGDKDEVVCEQFEQVCNASHLAFAGLLPLEDGQFIRFMEQVERRASRGFFLAPMDHDIMYLGVNEYIWHDLYLRLGQPQKAFAAMMTNLRHGMTQDTFQVQERYSLSMPEFTPWQPNGSGNGRILSMILDSICHERGGVATIFGGIPYDWLHRNGATALRDLRTLRGRISIEAVAAEDHCILTLTAIDAGAMPERVRFLAHLRCKADGIGGADGGFATAGLEQAVFRLMPSP